jgi:DNA uptake protein ComE-like DNA-binding protein
MSKLKNFLYFNKTERRGIFVLLSILLLLIISPYLFKFFKPKEKIDFLNFEKEIISFEKNQKKVEQSHYKTKTRYKKYNKSNIEINLTPFFFDPNNLTVMQWEKLGLHKRQIQTIKNYKAKGGKFYKKEDLKKIYSISEKEYNILKPYIQIKKTVQHKNYKNKHYKNKNITKKPVTIVELNSADSLDLLNIKGIGPYFSNCIIKFRNLLGGFCKYEQLLEVYGMDTTRYNQILPFVEINKDSIKKININKTSVKELIKHPYIDYYLAKNILQYKDKNKRYKSISEIKNLDLIYDELYKKIEPYITVNQTSYNKKNTTNL